MSSVSSAKPYPTEMLEVREYRFKLKHLDLENVNFTYSMKYQEASLELYDTEIIQDLQYYDIVELGMRELNPDSFGIMGNKFTMSDISFEIKNIPSSMRVDDGSSRTTTVKIHLYLITKDDVTYHLYNLQNGGVEPRKLYEDISNESEYQRAELFSWIRKYPDAIHSDYDEVKDELIVLSKLQ